MKEEPDPPPAPDPEAAADPAPARAPQPPLGAWRVPVFWMACGALLAMLAGSAFVVAQRVGLERDIAALAGNLPPATPAPAPAPALVAAPPAPPASIPAPEPTPVQAPAPLPPAQLERGVEAERPVAARPKRVAGSAQREKKQSYNATRARAPVRAAASRQIARSGTKAARQRARSVKPAAEHDLYWEVFKRCPLPGEPGAVECRRHVCNGAEREGPACKSYRGKWR